MPAAGVRKQTVCHPNVQHFAKGLCQSCYDKNRYANGATRNHQVRQRVERWKQSHPDLVRAKNKKVIDIKVEKIKALKAAPCMDCGVHYPHYVMEFDHREGTVKVSTVSRLLRNSPWLKVLEEIAKCDVVCANCHNARTFMRRVVNQTKGV